MLPYYILQLCECHSAWFVGEMAFNEINEFFFLCVDKNYGLSADRVNSLSYTARWWDGFKQLQEQATEKFARNFRPMVADFW